PSATRFAVEPPLENTPGQAAGMPHSCATQPSATRSRVLNACTAYRWPPAAAAASHAATAEVVGPVVMNPLHPGSPTRDPFGLTPLGRARHARRDPTAGLGQGHVQPGQPARPTARRLVTAVIPPELLDRRQDPLHRCRQLPQLSGIGALHRSG